MWVAELEKYCGGCVAWQHCQSKFSGYSIMQSLQTGDAGFACPKAASFKVLPVIDTVQARDVCVYPGLSEN